MEKYIEVDTGDNEFVRIEIEPVAAPSGIVPAASPEEIAIKAQEVFDMAMETIRRTANKLVQKIKEIDVLPDETEIQFGVKIDAEIGAVVAKAGTEAHYLVTLTWRQTSLKDNDGVA